MDITIWSCQKNQDLKVHLFLLLENGNLKRCPFGLAQAPAYFQRLVNEVLSGLTFAFGYLDDILVYSPDMETHLEHLRKLFIKLREANLKLKEVKCNFLKKHIQYLGHIVLGKGITPMPEKLACIKEMPPPKTPMEVKQFLGLNRILS